MNNYIFEYLNEVDFTNKEKSLRKYNKLAYKKLIFDIYHELRNGIFLGDIIEEERDFISYVVNVPTDNLFKKVYGEIKLFYTVLKNKNIILLTNITPEDILNEGHQMELETYKGVMISKSNPKKDIFKVNLLNIINK